MCRKTREDGLQDGSVATGTGHEMGTPLAGTPGLAVEASNPIDDKEASRRHAQGNDDGAASAARCSRNHRQVRRNSGKSYLCGIISAAAVLVGLVAGYVLALILGMVSFAPVEKQASSPSPMSSPTGWISASAPSSR